MATVRRRLAATAAPDLGRRGPRGFTVLGALQVLVLEEWAHHGFATRDLGRLEAPTSR